MIVIDTLDSLDSLMSVTHVSVRPCCVVSLSLRGNLRPCGIVNRSRKFLSKYSKVLFKTVLGDSGGLLEISTHRILGTEEESTLLLPCIREGSLNAS